MIILFFSGAPELNGEETCSWLSLSQARPLRPHFWSFGVAECGVPHSDCCGLRELPVTGCLTVASEIQLQINRQIIQFRLAIGTTDSARLLTDTVKRGG